MERICFEGLLKDKKLKVTSQRLQVLEIIADHPGEHLTAEDIYELAREPHPNIGIATIYRTLQVLYNLSVIDKISFGDGYVRYEMKEKEADRHRHHHAICQKCGKITSIENDLLENLEKVLFECQGFRVLNHEVKFYGYCNQCREKYKL